MQQKVKEAINEESLLYWEFQKKKKKKDFFLEKAPRLEIKLTEIGEAAAGKGPEKSLPQYRKRVVAGRSIELTHHFLIYIQDPIYICIF